MMSCPSFQRALAHSLARGSVGAMPHSSSAAGHSPKRKMTRAASAAACVPTWAPIEALVAELIAGTQRGFCAPASCVCLVHRVGVAGCDQRERVERHRPAPPRLRRPRRPDGAPPGWRAPSRCRCPSPRRRHGWRSGPPDRFPPSRANSPRRCRNPWWRRRRRCRPDDPGLCPRAFSSARCCQIGCFSSLSRISGVRTETVYGFPVMVRPPVLSALRRRNSIGSSGNAAAASSTSTSSAVMVCSVP